MQTLSSASPQWDVPSFTSVVLKDRNSRFCICVFVINEGEKIRKQLTSMLPYSGEADIVIADGGSTDGSLAIDYLRSRNVRALLTKTGPGKLSAQMRMAFAWALSEGYEGVITIDGNDKDDPSGIPVMIEALAAGYDHVQGSRFIPGGRAINTPISRLVGVRFIHAPLISLAARHRYTDTTNGFRAYSRGFLADHRVAPFRAVFSEYELHYYLAIRAARLGFRVTEVPVTRAYPPTGPVPTKISPLRGNLKILRTLFRACLHRFDPHPERSLNS